MSLTFLYSLERLGMKFGLENMRTITAALGHPERSFRSVIIAGTNGKGSVSAMTSAALHAAGHRTGRYTSPHLERLEERYVIAERESTMAELEDVSDGVEEAIEGLLRTGALESLPTFFECATAMAFELFRRSGVEVAVVEVGLGGRLDATNVITPKAGAITSIDFDHRELLGDTIEAIAREKAGVIKPAMTVVSGAMPAEALQEIEDVCRLQGARLVRADTVRSSFTIDQGRTVATFETSERRLQDVTLALNGRHQVANAAVAVALLEVLNAAGIGVDDRAIRVGLEQAHWPGRLERVDWHGAQVLLDAAHNPAGARSLAAYLTDIGWADVTLVVGALRDKDVAGILMPLVPFASSLVCATASSPRAMPADELAAMAKTIAPAEMPVASIPDPREAIETAARGGGRIVAGGSIFLIGPLRGILR